MKIKSFSLIKIEAVATIAWFLNDILWMWGYVKMALLLLPAIVVSMVISLLRTKNKNLKNILIITFIWLSMSSIWMISELFIDESIIISLKMIATSLGIFGILQLAFFFFKFGKMND